MSVVVRNVPRPDVASVAALAEFGVATVHEAQGRKGMLASYMRPIWRGARVAGAAVTVEVAPADNLMIHVAVEQCGKGDIMVVAPTSPSDAGYFGELLATSLMARGVAGLVIEAGCRDVAEISELGFPIWSKFVSAQGTVKETAGSVNVPIVCAGALIDPGDVIVADEDGVVVVRRREVTSVVVACRERLSKEADARARLKKGELGLDIYGMRTKLAGKGIVYRDFDPAKDSSA